MTEPFYELWCRQLFEHIKHNFSRAEPRLRAWKYLLSLADASADGRGSRKHLALYPGERRADGAQRLLTSAQWDESRVRADLLGFVTTRFGATGGTLYVTEMAFPKKGMQAAAVQRQFSVDSARQENCQIGILLFYEAVDGSLVLIDRELYVPESWINDAERCRRAGMPPGTAYRSKSAIAVDLVHRALAANIVPQWTLLSVLCPQKAAAQRALRREGLQHMVALTPSEFALTTRARDSRAFTVSYESRPGVPVSSAHAWRTPTTPHRARAVPVQQIRTASAPTSRFDVSYLADAGGGRRDDWSPGHFSAYTARDLAPGKLTETMGAFGRLAARSRCLRDQVGVDRYEVRSWRGWYRHMTLVMVAQTAMAIASTDRPPGQPAGRAAARPTGRSTGEGARRERVARERDAFLPLGRTR
ncbi:IS701 family transposase [Streptomyces sp. 4N509B]|uniref:IS701 family transposase n=1 Tax=Streptomyces sp. 4N509B TaxID=3457413 RepID=UPI003FD48EDC